ncbi:MAG: hypothetical protein GY750_15660 [Lentisphaerae bacterium]|nr:hypothetical protein [Lentisphaerota bacterium]MCP4102834.1 hypothetical protein [Lentisphaerota bacterium]
MLNDICIYDKSFIPIGGLHVLSDFFKNPAMTIQAYLKKHLITQNKKVVTIWVDTGETPTVKASPHKDLDVHLTWPSWV